MSKANKWFKRHRLLLGLSLMYFFTRSLFLAVFPLFEDEAAYINFALLIKKNILSHWSVSFRLGLGPVLPNIIALMLHFTTDPVLAGRFATVAVSYLAFYAIGIIAETVFNRSASPIARLLYIVLPYSFLHDRLALLDATAVSFSLFAIVCFIRIAQRRVGYWFLGLVSLYLAVLTKPTGLLTFALVPLIAVPVKFRNRFQSGVFAGFISLILSIEAAAFLLILATISQSLDVFIPVYDRVVDTKVSVPWWFVRENAHKAFIWLTQYSSFPFVALALIGGLLVFVKRRRFLPFFACWGSVTLVLSVLISKFWYPRYLLPSVPLLLLLASGSLSVFWEHVRSRKVGQISFFLILLFLIKPFIYNDYLLAFKPLEAVMPAEDRVLYFNLWTSGVFAQKAQEFFRQRLKEEKKVMVFTDTMKILQVGFSLPLERENVNFHAVAIRELTFPAGSLPREITAAAQENSRVYLVLTRYPYAPEAWHLHEEKAYISSQGLVVLRIYSYTQESK